jgi:hypothetical protein
MGLPWGLVDKVAWATGNVVEDMQLGIDYALAGYPPLVVPEVKVLSDLPATESGLLSQRRRWEHGFLMTALAQVPQLLSQCFERRSWSLLVMACDMAVPPLALLSVLWLAPVRRQMRGDARRRLSARLALGIACGVVLMGALGQAFAAVKARRDWQQGTHAWNRIEQASVFLQRETLPDQPVLMNVWLDWAELYWRVPRPAPALSIAHVVPRDRYEEWLEITRAAFPEWIVTDGTPWEPVDGPLRGKAQQIRDEFTAQIEREYALVRQIDGLRILKRRSER